MERIASGLLRVAEVELQRALCRRHRAQGERRQAWMAATAGNIKPGSRAPWCRRAWASSTPPIALERLCRAEGGCEAVVTGTGSDVVAPLQGRRLAAIGTLSRRQVSFAQGRRCRSSSSSADASNPCYSARYSVLRCRCFPSRCGAGLQAAAPLDFGGIAVGTDRAVVGGRLRTGRRRDKGIAVIFAGQTHIPGDLTA
jgi:hypothetical protein